MNKRLREKLKSKPFRDAFFATHINTSIAFQIRAMRQRRKWSQRKLGQKIGRKKALAQSRVSKLETPGRTAYTMRALERVASAFDVALMVRFVPYGDLTRFLETLGPDSYVVPSFNEEVAAAEAAEARGSAGVLLFSRPPMQLSTGDTARPVPIPEAGPATSDRIEPSVRRINVLRPRGAYFSSVAHPSRRTTTGNS